MKFSGIFKVLSALGLDFFIFYQLAGIEAAFMVTALVFLAVWSGEYIDVARNHGIRIDKAPTYEKIKLTNAYKCLADRILDVEGRNIGTTRLYVIPDDNANAFSYGFSCIGVTSGLLRNVDDITLGSILAHELSHKINLDAVFKRIVFVNILAIMGILSVAAVLSSAMVWIVFLTLCLLGVCCGGFFSYFMASGISRTSKALFCGIQRAVVFVFQAGIGLVSRHSEYRADDYSAKLGYGQQLKYFLRRFAVGQEEKKTGRLTDVLYNTHPLTSKRIARLEEHTYQASIRQQQR